MSAVLRDLRYSIRVLARDRAFSIGIIGTLALGMAAATIVLAVADAVLFRPVPGPHARELVRVSVEVPQRSGKRVELDPSAEDRARWQSYSKSLSHISASRRVPRLLVYGAEPERVAAMRVTGTYFDAYDVAPVLGRLLDEGDARGAAPPVAVVSYAYWKRELGGNPQVIGQTLRHEGGASEIVGVLPASFYPTTAVWLPLAPIKGRELLRGSGVTVHGRLHDGISAAAAGRELTAIAVSAGGQRQHEARVIVRRVVEQVAGQYRTTIRVLAGCMGLLLLLVGVNVSGLYLARFVTRDAEFALRVAVGAPRSHLVRQLMIEALVISAAASALGIGIAWVSLDPIVANLPITLPPSSHPRIDMTLLTYSFIVMVSVGLTCGLPRVMRLSRRTFAADALKPGLVERLPRHVGHIIVASEVAISMVLGVNAGLVITSFDRLLNVDLGFNPDQFTSMEVRLVGTSPAAADAYYQALIAALSTVPGVASVGATDQPPLVGSSIASTIELPGGDRASVDVRQVLPGYFQTVGTAILSGRDISSEDRSGHSISGAVINQEASARLFGAGDPVGHQFVFQGDTLRIVGVSENIRHRGPSGPIGAEIYVPYRPSTYSKLPDLGLTIVVRGNGSSNVPVEELRRVATSASPAAVVERVQSGTQMFFANIELQTKRTFFVSLLGTIALVLTLVGIAGVTTYTTTKRQCEIGIRLALGASRARVVTAIVGEAMRPSCLGIVIGWAVAAASARLVSSFLFGTEPTEPVIFMQVASVVGAAATIAAWIAARTAVSMDPAQLLRRD